MDLTPDSTEVENPFEIEFDYNLIYRFASFAEKDTPGVWCSYDYKKKGTHEDKVIVYIGIPDLDKRQQHIQKLKENCGKFRLHPVSEREMSNGKVEMVFQFL